MPVSNVSIAGRVDYARLRADSDASIIRRGMRAVLRRVGLADRWCDVVLIEWKNQEMLGGQYDPLLRKAVIAAGTLEGPDPVADKDRLVTFKQPMDTNDPIVDEILRITMAPVPLKPGGVILQWVLAVRA